MVKIGKDSQGGAKPVLWVFRQGLRYLTDENKLEVGGDKLLEKFLYGLNL